MNILVFAATAVLSLILTRFLIRIASRYGISRHNGSGRLKKRVLSLSGGVVIYISFVLVTGAAFLFSRGRLLGVYDCEYLGVVLGGALMLLLGLRDAVRKVPPGGKLALQALAGLALLGCGYRMDVITFFPGGEIHTGWAGPILLLIWVVGITNAFSLIDTVDGLAAGLAAIAAVTLFFAGLPHQPFVPFLALAAAGACAGFLRYNSYPARIHLGRAGTFFLGFVLAAVSARGSIKSAAGIALLLPILALLTAVSGHLAGFFSGNKPDREPRQLSDRLFGLGYSTRQTVLLLCFLQANLGMIALVAAAADKVLALGMFFLVGSMLYLLFRITEDYRSRILTLDREAEANPSGKTP